MNRSRNGCSWPFAASYEGAPIDGELGLALKNFKKVKPVRHPGLRDKHRLYKNLEQGHGNIESEIDETKICRRRSAVRFFRGRYGCNCRAFDS